MLELFFALVAYLSLPDRGAEWLIASSSVYNATVDTNRVVFNLVKEDTSKKEQKQKEQSTDTSYPDTIVAEPLSTRANVLVVSYGDNHTAVDLYSILKELSAADKNTIISLSYKEKQIELFFDGQVLILSSEGGVFTARLK